MHNPTHTPKAWPALAGWYLAAFWSMLVLLALVCVVVFVQALTGGHEQQVLATLGLHPELIIVARVFEVTRMLTYTATALLILGRLPRDPVALFAAFILIGAGAFIPSASEALAVTLGAALPADFSLVVTALVCFYLIFPDGHLVPRWGWLLPLGWAIWALIVVLLPGNPADPATWPPPLQFIQVMGWLGVGLAAQYYRYRHVASQSQREQTCWVLYGAAITYGTALGFVAVPIAVPELRTSSLPIYFQIGGALRTLLMLALPVSMAMAVLRYRLWGVEPIVRRALVYSTWTLSVAAIYGFVVGALSLLFRTTGNALIALVATGVSAILFQPLRDRLQRAIGRLLYGERDAPYVAMARLGQRLEDTLTPETVLPTLVETIAQALRLPYVAIALQQDDVLVLAASYPSDPTTQPEAAGEAFNLTHQGAMIGQLQVQLRAPEEPLTEQDRRLLADLARQASAALHGLRLQRELQRTINELGQSRERLVLAREEERRRLRRDLHDGIGPTLASLVQRIDRVRVLIPNDPTGADAALVELKAIARTAVADIRGLVYALRPPVLDELGLVGALRQHAESYAFGPLAVRIDAPEPPLALSAAVEVASYRIVLEALTNVARHAQANTCQVRIVLEPHAHGGVLELEILDDGIGIPADRTIGVGLTAIAERVAELGGTLMIGQNQPCGTRVYAWLPVSAVRHDQAEPSFDHG